MWRAHLSLRLRTLGPIRLAWPRSDLPRRDPRALRFVVLVLIVPLLAKLLAVEDCGGLRPARTSVGQRRE